MGNLAFSESGWDDYLYWQTEDKKNAEADQPAFAGYFEKWL